MMFFAILGVATSAILAAMGFLGRENVVGIDLGTTFSVAALKKYSGEVELIPNKFGRPATPSIVSFLPNGDVLVGQEAVNASNTFNFGGTVYNAKRFIGRKFDEAQIAHDAATFPFGIVQGKSLDPKSDAADIYFSLNATGPAGGAGALVVSPEDVGFHIIKSLLQAVRAHVGHAAISAAVICVPAKFNNAQKRATRRVFERAGLRVARVLEEPTAAAIAYGLHKDPDVHNIIVFDIGGGTLDVSLLYVTDGSVQVLLSDGDDHLGGEDFNQVIVNWIHEQDATAKACSDEAVVRQQAERSKCALSATDQARVTCGDATHVLTKAVFEERAQHLFKRCLLTITRVLEAASMTAADIDEVVMVGGSSRIPKLHTDILEYFGGKPPRTDIDPDMAVALGAARVLD